MCMHYSNMFVIQNEAVEFGIDWEGPVGSGADNDSVDVPETPCPLPSSCLEELYAEVDPLSHSDLFGIDLYEQTKFFVSCKIRSV